MTICPRCNGTGEDPTCEYCTCILCHGSGELDEPEEEIDEDE